MEVLYGLVLSLLLSVSLCLSKNKNNARGLMVGQLYRLNCPVYHILKYTAVLHSLAMWKRINMKEIDLFLQKAVKQPFPRFFESEISEKWHIDLIDLVVFRQFGYFTHKKWESPNRLFHNRVKNQISILVFH
jgi:hypothetical protein